MIVPGDLLFTDTSLDCLRLQTLLVDEPPDFASAEQTIFFRTLSGFAGTSELAAVPLAVRVFDGEATAIVDSTHVDLPRVNPGVQEKLHGGVDLREIGLRLDLRPKPINMLWRSW